MEFLAIFIPALGAIWIWHKNQSNQREWEQYKRREERYRQLITTSSGFHVHGADLDKMQAFLDQLDLCWLYAPDSVIRKAYDFLETVHTGSQTTNEDRETALGILMVTIRKDMLSGSYPRQTALVLPQDFHHLSVAIPQPSNVSG